MTAPHSTPDPLPLKPPPDLAAAISTAEELSATIIYSAAGERETAAVSDSNDRTDIGVLSPGTLLKHFRIVRLIGRGGMGDVYEALDESLERTVALKVIQAGKKIAASDHARLIHEARSQARLNHPHVVQIYYVGLESECPFLAMEFVAGKTLAESLREHRPTFRTVVRIGVEVAEALNRAAEMGIVHSDIKPSNIILDQSGAAKLSDFGLARPVTADHSRTGALTGTPKYMAPELFEGAPNSAASDMYSLGITLFELTFGNYPYDETAATLSRQITLHRSAAIEFPKPWPAEFPEGWRSILERLLAKQPGHRFANYRDLQSAITRFQPTTRLPARLLPRLLAYFVDTTLLTIVRSLFQLGRIVLAWVLEKYVTAHLIYLGGVATTVAEVGAFAVLIWAHAKFRTTPGKHLFQISIADPHGLDPVPTRLMSRLILSQFPVALLVAYDALHQISGEHLSWLFPIASVTAGIWGLGNLVSIFMGSQRLALHDRLLGTRVVVEQATAE
jgi:hypothetical protein